VNAIWVLMGLLLLAYVGSFLFGSHAIRGIGLPSGAEYVVLGFIVGPSVLGLLERATLADFDPLAHVALGWLVFVVGATYGTTQGGRVPARRLVVGWLTTGFTGALVGGAVWLLLPWAAPSLAPLDRLLIAGGVGAAAAETTRYAVRWVVERHHAAGPVSELIGAIAEGDDLVPLLAVAALFTLAPAQFTVPISRLGLVGVTIGIGVVLGAVAAALLGRTFRIAETWGVLFGVLLLGVGIAERLGLSTITTMFALGLTLSLLSPHRRELGAMLAPTERPVMLPALLLAGARVDFGAAPWLPQVLALAVAARIAGKWVVGLGLLSASRAARPAGARLGLGLLPAGALSMSIGLAFALRFHGATGAVVLAAAAVMTLFGEFVGPASLRAALARAGEIPDAPASSARGASA
jgi:Kef-type K+ transport system membrane component KefB